MSGTYVADVPGIAATLNFFQIYKAVSTGNWGRISDALKKRRDGPLHHCALFNMTYGRPKLISSDCSSAEGIYFTVMTFIFENINSDWSEFGPNTSDWSEFGHI